MKYSELDGYTAILERIDNIKEQLKAWREERLLTQEHQKETFFRNSMEEVWELMSAKKNRDKVDALCDLLVIALNSFSFVPGLSEGQAIVAIARNEYKQIAQMGLNSVKIDFDDGSGTSLVLVESREALINEISRINRLIYTKGFIMNSGDTMRYITGLLASIAVLGYDPLDSLEETIKEISSRRQDPKQKAEWERIIKEGGKPSGKWQKDLSQTDTYKAQYEELL